MSDNRNRPETRDPGSYVFHYSREERLAGRPEKATPRRGFFRNRALVIVMADIILVLMMFGIYMLFLRRDPGEATVEGYRIESSAFSYDSDVYVTVTVEATDDVATIADGADTLFNVDLPGATTLTDVLPTDPGFPTVVRHSGPASTLLDPESDTPRVSLTVRMLGTEEVLTPRVKE